MTKNDVHVFIGSYGDKANCFTLKLGLISMWIKQKPLSWRRGLTRYTASDMAIGNQIIYVLGGPVVPFIIAGIFYLIASLFKATGIIHSFLSVFSYYAFIMFVIGIFPLKIKAKTSNGNIIYNDGFKL